MKNVMEWVKSNVLIVIFTLVIVAVPAGAFVVAGMWGESVRADQQKKAQAELTRVQGAKVDYYLPAFEPGAQAYSFKAEPNAKLTAWFKEHRDKLTSQAARIVDRAVAFNQGKGSDAAAVGRREHTVLVEGLFGDVVRNAALKVLEDRQTKAVVDAMQPADKAAALEPIVKELTQAKAYEFEDKILGKRGNPNPYQQLLEGIRAGERADVVRLAEAVEDLRHRETEKITAQKRDLTEEEHAVLQRQLSERRLAEYQSHAKGFSVYASMSIFPKESRLGAAIPTGNSLVPEQLDPNRPDMYLYQWDLWVFSDMLAAVRLANTTPDGTQTSVEDSVVKRVLSVTLKDAEGMFEELNPGDPTMTATPAAPPVPGIVPLDPLKSVTGRATSAANTVYDVRRGTITAVVASDRVSAFLSAIERTNFMTVTGLKVTSADIWADLKDGFYYGQGHVVIVEAEVESVWLRAWTSHLAPDVVKSLLKYPDAPPPPAGAAAAPASGPAAPVGRGAKGAAGPR